MRELRRLLLVTGLLAIGVCHAAERSNVLRTNPFLQPVLDDAAALEGSKSATGPVVELQLRATMVAGSSSQANIGGVILGLGEEVNGYRLTEVHQRRVVLDRDGSQKEIRIDDENRDSD